MRMCVCVLVCVDEKHIRNCFELSLIVFFSLYMAKHGCDMLLNRVKKHEHMCMRVCVLVCVDGKHALRFAHQMMKASFLFFNGFPVAN